LRTAAAPVRAAITSAAITCCPGSRQASSHLRMWLLPLRPRELTCTSARPSRTASGKLRSAHERTLIAQSDFERGLAEGPVSCGPRPHSDTQNCLVDCPSSCCLADQRSGSIIQEAYLRQRPRAGSQTGGGGRAGLPAAPARLHATSAARTPVHVDSSCHFKSAVAYECASCNWAVLLHAASA